METSEVVANERIAKETWQLTLANPGIAKRAGPGQFVTLHHPDSDSVMRRPFSIWFADPKSGQVEIIFREVGKNTRLYAGLRPGGQISVSGPRGNAVEIKSDWHRILFVAGGCGLASFHFCLAQLARQQKGPEVQVIAGFPSHGYIFGQDEFHIMKRVGFCVATEDGSDGVAGTAVGLFQSRLLAVSPASDVKVFTCGPLEMMQAVFRICQKAGCQCWAFLEQIMACGGRGDCKSCAVPILGRDLPQYVCKHGPVFAAWEVDWDEFIKRSRS